MGLEIFPGGARKNSEIVDAVIALQAKRLWTSFVNHIFFLSDLGREDEVEAETEMHWKEAVGEFRKKINDINQRYG
jgi:hypothetical protein